MRKGSFHGSLSLSSVKDLHLPILVLELTVDVILTVLVTYSVA